MQNQNALGMLFDMSFSEFVTTRVIKLLFILGVLFAAIGTFILIAGAFSGGMGRGLLSLVISPFVFLIYVLFARIWCEMIIVVFRIAENTSRLANRDPAPPPAA